MKRLEAEMSRIEEGEDPEETEDEQPVSAASPPPPPAAAAAPPEKEATPPPSPPPPPLEALPNTADAASAPATESKPSEVEEPVSKSV